MKTIVTLGLVGALVALGACGAPPGITSLKVVQADGYKFPALPTSGCDISGGTLYTDGALDFGERNSYVYTFDISDLLSFPTATATLTPSTYDFTAQKVVSDYVGTDDATTTALSGLHSEVAESFNVAEGAKSQPDELELITPSVGKAMVAALGLTKTSGTKTVLVRFHVAGLLGDGTPETTNTFQWPIVVCNGSGCTDPPPCPSGYVAYWCHVGELPSTCLKAP